MADIKTKKKQEFNIKKLDRATIMGKNLKENIVNLKEKTKENYEKSENTAQEYARNKIDNTIKDTIYYTPILNKKGKQNFENTKENIAKGKMQIKKAKKEIRNVKRKGKIAIKKAERNIKNFQKNVKLTQRKVKTAEKVTHQKVKVTKQLAKNSAKLVQRTAQMTKQAVKNTIHATKVAIRTTIQIVKAIIAATKALVSAIIAGGWVAVVIIVVISLIALICTSIFGIFFSNEKGVGDITMSSVIAEINMEFNNKLIEIQNTNPHDDYEINSNRAEWKDIISVYAVIITGGKDQSDVITLDDKKIQKLKDVFWEMNVINYHVEDVEKDIEIINDDGTTTIEKQIRKTLYIDITNVSVEEMTNRYNFNKNQREQLTEIMKEEYASLWSGVLYGSTIGSTDIVEVARSQLGNVGGQPYWSWYGFSSRVSWCACFVSWCADQCGYIQSGVIPKFASCQLEGVNWFKACGLWQDGGYIPKSGDIIFFDWNEKHDGHSDHVGIVEKVENGRVYTIEGNSNNACNERNYDINSNEIQGYGTPMY